MNWQDIPRNWPTPEFVPWLVGWEHRRGRREIKVSGLTLHGFVAGDRRIFNLPLRMPAAAAAVRPQKDTLTFNEPITVSSPLLEVLPLLE